MSQIQEELTENMVALNTGQKVQKHFTKMQKQLQDEIDELNKIEKHLKKEQRDVEKLEGKSMRGFFHKVLGDRERQLEKERQEYLQVSLRYNDLTKSVDLLTFELEILQKKIVSLDQLENKVKVLMEKREEELMRTDPILGKELLLIHKKMDQAHIASKDVDEAVAAGMQALDSLRRMEGELQAAKNWGQYDMMGNRGQAGYVKHRAIDRARNLAQQTKHYLLRFREELQDVYQDVQLDLRLEMQDFSRFTDIFFDNLITDWIVQQKIKNTLNSVVHVRKQVETAVNHLHAERPKIDKDLEALNIQREQTILKSGE